MKRRMFLIGLFVAIGYFIVHSSGCGNRQGELDPTTPIQPTLASTSVVDGHVRLDEVLIRIFIPQLMEEKEIYDPWLYNTIISILPEETRIRFLAEGSVFIEDVAISSLILVYAGIESFEVPGGLLLVDEESWGCIKCCYSEENNCPGCYCDKDKDHGVVPYIEY